MNQQDYIQRPRQTPYYNDGNYRQYSGLTSGITMGGNNAISSGWENMMSSMMDVQKQEYADETERQTKFKNLIDVSLKDVRGQWRDEAVKKKQAFLNNATKLAAESQGKLTWDQEKQMMAEKEGLEQFAGMSQEVTDWYNKAITTAVQMKDKAAQKATFDNINNIMTNSGGLAETHAKTLNPNWMVQKKYTLTEGADLIKPVNRRSDGRPDIDAMEAQAEALITTNHPAIMAQKEFYDNNPVAQKAYPTFAKWWAGIKANQMNSMSADKLRYIDKTKKDKPAIEKLPVTQDVTGRYRYGDYNEGKGIGIGTVKVDGQTYKDAAIRDDFIDENGNEWVSITHALPNESIVEYTDGIKASYLRKAKKDHPKASEKEAQKIADEKFQDWSRLNMTDLDRYSKDQTKGFTEIMPMYQWKNTIDRYITKTPNNERYSIGGKEFTGPQLYNSVKRKHPELSEEEIIEQMSKFAVK